MSRVSQRVQIGLVLLLLSLALVFPVHSWASAPITRKSGPGFYRMMLGDFEITVISDGTFREPVDTLLTNTTKAVVDQELKENFESSPYEMSDNCFVVNTGRKLILIDTGAGSLMGPTLGHLLPNLAAAGYRPEQVDEVYITHLHPDHIGLADTTGTAFNVGYQTPAPTSGPGYRGPVPAPGSAFAATAS